MSQDANYSYTTKELHADLETLEYYLLKDQTGAARDIIMRIRHLSQERHEPEQDEQAEHVRNTVMEFLAKVMTVKQIMERKDEIDAFFDALASLPTATGERS